MAEDFTPEIDKSPPKVPLPPSVLKSNKQMILDKVNAIATT